MGRSATDCILVYNVKLQTFPYFYGKVCILKVSCIFISQLKNKYGDAFIRGNNGKMALTCITT